MPHFSMSKESFELVTHRSFSFDRAHFIITALGKGVVACVFLLERRQDFKVNARCLWPVHGLRKLRGCSGLGSLGIIIILADEACNRRARLPVRAHDDKTHVIVVSTSRRSATIAKSIVCFDSRENSRTDLEQDSRRVNILR